MSAIREIVLLSTYLLWCGGVVPIAAVHTFWQWLVPHIDCTPITIVSLMFHTLMTALFFVFVDTPH